MIVSNFSRNSKGKILLSEALESSASMGYFSRSLGGQAGDIMDIFMRLPDVHLIMVGPSGCSRLLYFRAARKGLTEKLRVYPISSVDFTVGHHMVELEKLVEEVIHECDPRGIILNITCIDTLAANDFDSIIRRAKKKYGVIVQVYHRGPVISNREAAGARFSDIFMKLMEECEIKNKEKQVNIISRGELLDRSSQLYQLLHQVYDEKNIREFSQIQNQEDLNQMTAAELNLLVGGFGISLAREMTKSWGIPSVSLSTCFHPDEIKKSVEKLTNQLKTTWNLEEEHRNFLEKAAKLAPKLKDKKIAIGVGMRSLELAWTLQSVGISVQAVLVGFLLMNYPFSEIPGFELPPEKEYGKKLLSSGNDLDFYLLDNITFKLRSQELSKIDIAIGQGLGAYCRRAKVISLRDGYKFGYEGILEVLEGLV